MSKATKDNESVGRPARSDRGIDRSSNDRLGPDDTVNARGTQGARATTHAAIGAQTPVSPAIAARPAARRKKLLRIADKAVHQALADTDTLSAHARRLGQTVADAVLPKSARADIVDAPLVLAQGILGHALVSVTLLLCNSDTGLRADFSIKRLQKICADFSKQCSAGGGLRPDLSRPYVPKPAKGSKQDQAIVDKRLLEFWEIKTKRYANNAELGHTATAKYTDAGLIAGLQMNCLSEEPAKTLEIEIGAVNVSGEYWLEQPGLIIYDLAVTLEDLIELVGRYIVEAIIRILRGMMKHASEIAIAVALLMAVLILAVEVVAVAVAEGAVVAADAAVATEVVSSVVTAVEGVGGMAEVISLADRAQKVVSSVEGINRAAAALLVVLSDWDVDEN